MFFSFTILFTIGWWISHNPQSEDLESGHGVLATGEGEVMR